MASPTTILRSGFDTLLSGALTFTKSSGSANASYFERFPGLQPHYPFVRYKNCVLTESSSKDCIGWDVSVTIEVVTGFTPGHGSFDFADELESQVIALVTDRPYALSLTGYNIVSSVFEDSDYDEGLIKGDSSKPSVKDTYIIAKQPIFRLILSEA